MLCPSTRSASQIDGPGVTKMETNHSFLSSHCWVSRRLELVPGQPLVQRVCHECGRAFVEDRITGERYAVHVSIFKLHRLSDEVTSRWLFEKCPAEPQIDDNADRQTRYLLAPVVDEPAAAPIISVVPASTITTANALRAVARGKSVKNGIPGPIASASSSKNRELRV